jgi:DMSO/TMAO reductase YedYZ molybdopterin-dependent catalytic subunit
MGMDMILRWLDPEYYDTVKILARPGLWAAAAALLAQWLLHMAMRDAPFAPYAIADRIIRESPGPLATWAIEQMGHNAQQALGWGCIAVALPLGLLLGRRSPALFGVLAFLLTVLAARVAPMTADAGPMLLSATVTGLAAGLAAFLLTPVDDRSGAQADPTRRRLIAGAGLGVLFWITGAGAVARRQTEKAPAGAVRADTPAVISPDTSFAELTHLSPRITPTSQHYVVDIDLDDPHPGDGWQLSVKGSVENELSFSLADLRDMQTAEILLIMQCISNNVGGGLAGNSKWTGISTASLLAMAKPAANASHVLVRSEDGYTDVVDLAALQGDEAMIAFGMNGSVLPRNHGYPARLLYPGHYGMRSVKWLKELVLLDHDDEGYWAERGWDREALMRTASRIDVAENAATGGPLTVAGVAWAGDRRISKVEVSADEGKTWQEATLENELGPLAWRRWRVDLQLEPGEYRVEARAYDGARTVQDKQRRAPHPSGASGYDSISVKVG